MCRYGSRSTVIAVAVVIRVGCKAMPRDGVRPVVRLSQPIVMMTRSPPSQPEPAPGPDPPAHAPRRPAGGPARECAPGARAGDAGGSLQGAGRGVAAQVRHARGVHTSNII